MFAGCDLLYVHTLGTYSSIQQIAFLHMFHSVRSIGDTAVALLHTVPAGDLLELHELPHVSWAWATIGWLCYTCLPGVSYKSLRVKPCTWGIRAYQYGLRARIDECFSVSQLNIPLLARQVANAHLNFMASHRRGSAVR